MNVLQGKKKKNCNIDLFEIELSEFNLTIEKLYNVANRTFVRTNYRADMFLLVDASNFALSAAIAIAFIGKMVTYILFLLKRSCRKLVPDIIHSDTN